MPETAPPPVLSPSILTFVMNVLKNPAMRLILNEGPRVVQIVEEIAGAVNGASIPAGSSTLKTDLLKAAATMGPDSPAQKLFMLGVQIMDELETAKKP
ncbi:MAG: hypothetical protein EPN91_02075 [Salinibacterium sp.]|nr:MAG: hypothetical protein EPN91_02075 [Salinibacterium sp.]